MPSLNISLSDELKSYVEAQIKGGSYGNVSEYFRSLIRDHQRRDAQERLEFLLLEGVASKDDGPMTLSDWAQLRRAAHRRGASKRRRAGAKSTKRP